MLGECRRASDAISSVHSMVRYQTPELRTVVIGAFIVIGFFSSRIFVRYVQNANGFSRDRLWGPQGHHNTTSTNKKKVGTHTTRRQAGVPPPCPPPKKRMANQQTINRVPPCTRFYTYNILRRSFFVEPPRCPTKKKHKTHTTALN